MSAEDRNDDQEDTLDDVDQRGASIDETKGDAIDETLQWAEPSDQTTTDVPSSNTEATRVFAGGSAANQTASDLNEETVDEVPPSVMHSRDISQTINPRELSKEDAAFWGSAAIGASKQNKAEPSQLRPAVERSITESKLQIRERDLAIPTRDPDSPSDYRLIRLLGRGGMGNVYVARQASLDRMIAVKVIKPLPKAKRQSLRQSGRLKDVEHERRQQFLSEAVVTGDLDHPNIVPIHDIAVAADNTLFYAMKRVVGQPWLKTIEERSRDENLEILLKVCDAIAFAHTRGVIHRDIKPENIMLGDFGEVLVMDWGLAIAKPEFEKRDSITFTAGLGGTPAFMAPEMALGPVEAIGPHSDIYLLGATLFYIITGVPPHRADNVSQCIRKVAANEIQDASTQHGGELLEIALRAMATDPKQRYESVQAFQQAIRSYRSHSESIAISTAAQQEYQRAQETLRYESFSRAGHGFEQALALWDGNQAAMEGLDRCRIDHAAAAYENGDYDLGLSLLNPNESKHLPLIEKLNAGLHQREQRLVRLRLMRRLVTASLLFILVGGSIALYVINQKRNEANEQRELAETQQQVAEQQSRLATEQRDRAEESEQLAANRLVEVEREKAKVELQKKIAEDNERDAKDARILAEENEQKAKDQELIAKQNADDALRQKLKAERSEKAALVALERARYESYLSQIGLAKARVDGNEFDDARLILTSIRAARRDQSPAWEWRYLWHLANQSRSSFRFDSGVSDLAMAADGRSGVVVCNDGTVHRAKIGDASGPIWTRDDLFATCADIAIDGQWCAIGTQRGTVLIVDPMTGRTLHVLDGHSATVNDLEFLADGRLLSASSDRTVALWDPGNERRVSRGWHIAPVVSLASRQSDSGDPPTIIAAVSDGKAGRVVAWQIQSDRFARIGEFSGHSFPAIALALSSDGQLAASGDTRGNVFLWRPRQLRPTDFDAALQRAIDSISDNPESPEPSVAGQPATPTQTPTQTAARSDGDAIVASWKAHPDAIAVMRFDDVDQTLLTGSDDYTIAAWMVADQSLRYTLRGHGGWVRALAIRANAVGLGDAAIVSGSADGTVRVWDRSTPESVSQDVDDATDETQGPATQIRTTPEHGTQLHGAQLNGTRLHGDEILAARLDRSGSRVISASRDHTARILGLDRTGLMFRELARINTNEAAAGELNEGTEFLAMSARLDASGKRLFVGSADATIRIWDVDSGTQLGVLQGTGLNNAFALSQDGRRLLSGSSRPDAKALLWDVDRRNGAPKIVHRLTAGDQAVTAFALSSDGEFAATGDRGGRCLQWDATTGQPIGPPIDLLRGYRINDLAISPDDQSLWVASDNGQLTEIDLQSRQPRRRLDHDGFVTALSLSPRGDQAITITAQTANNRFVTTATWWDLATQDSRRLDRVAAPLDADGQAAGDSARLTSARFGNRGNQVVVCRQTKDGRGGRVILIDLASQKNKAFDLPAAIGAPETGLLSLSDQLITLNGEAAFRWSIDAMAHVKSYRPHASVVDACFFPDGKIAATASRSVRLWQTDSGEAIDKLENPHAGAITGLDVSSRMDELGYRIATCGAEAAARLWIWKDRQSGFRLEREFGIDEAEIKQLQFSPDGGRLMLAGADGSIQLHPIDGSAATFRWRLPEGLAPTCVAFSSDGRYLAVGASDKTAWLIDSMADTDVKPRVMRGHADRIESIAVLNDGSGQVRVLTASRDKSARVWDPRLEVLEDDLSADSELIFGREVLALRRHTQGVTAIDCTGDGDLVMTAARDGKVLLWPAPQRAALDPVLP
ncbi:Serine/threonine-protein kinase PknD [Stieleria neptunia]|uniref:Serine/threonine-protein kinase PknD n=1 Tax=Stieleria neptunia TaxID=2527979 RepID=A0A518HRW2_9BACT|nr:protein kinase [Stieleria neptunia]QDV43554.1 Serine/threonine-protein kinase PknD [Stieleria neptunia]